MASAAHAELFERSGHQSARTAFRPGSIPHRAFVASARAEARCLCKGARPPRKSPPCWPLIAAAAILRFDQRLERNIVLFPKRFKHRGSGIPFARFPISSRPQSGGSSRHSSRRPPPRPGPLATHPAQSAQLAQYTTRRPRTYRRTSSLAMGYSLSQFKLHPISAEIGPLQAGQRTWSLPSRVWHPKNYTPTSTL